MNVEQEVSVWPHERKAASQGSLESQSVRLLVSVRSADEAVAALHGGVDLVDVKEPSRGPLGRADDSQIQSIADLAAGQAPVSVALGELSQFTLPIHQQGVQFFKLGLAGAPADWAARLNQMIQVMPPSQFVVAAYADYKRAPAPDPDSVFDWANNNKPAGILIDTAIKDGTNLFDWLDEKTLQSYIQQARETGVMIALAGSLHEHSFLKAIELNPSYVAVRGAACQRNDRHHQIQAHLVKNLAAQVAEHNSRINLQQLSRLAN